MTELGDTSVPTGMPELSQLAPGSLGWGIAVASAAHIFFHPLLPQREDLARFLGKPFTGTTFDIWCASDFVNYIQKVGGQPGDATRITRLLASMERAGLLLNAGWDSRKPLLGQQYVAQGTLSAQREGTLWLSEVLGPELIIEAYKAVTVMITGGEGSPGGTGLILDGSHVLTNKHVVNDLIKRKGPLEIHAPYSNQTEPNQRVVVFMDDDIDVAVLRVEPPNDGCFRPLPGMVFRDPQWADELYLMGYPPVPWTVSRDISLQRGEVVSPMCEMPPVQEEDRDPWNVPQRTKIFLYSAIARPGNSGGPIIAHDGRVIGIVVEHSMETSSSDPDGAASAEQRQPSTDADRSDIAPFYRGIPTSEILRALRNLDARDSDNELHLEALIKFEDPLHLGG